MSVFVSGSQLEICSFCVFAAPFLHLCDQHMFQIKLKAFTFLPKVPRPRGAKLFYFQMWLVSSPEEPSFGLGVITKLIPDRLHLTLAFCLALGLSDRPRNWASWQLSSVVSCSNYGETELPAILNFQYSAHLKTWKSNMGKLKQIYIATDSYFYREQN